MKYFDLINKIHTAVVVIDKEMNVVEANKAFQQRYDLSLDEIIGNKCYKSAYLFSEQCDYKEKGTCSAIQSFNTKTFSSSIHHNWINNHAVVEEITSTPIFEDNGEVNYILEEFRDVTQLLGLKKGIIGICSYCRKLRDEDGKWVSFEAYFHKHTGANFSHGICENCIDTLSNHSNGKDGCSH